MTDHGMKMVTAGLQSGNDKLILLILMRENIGYPLMSGEPITLKLSIPITEMTGTFTPSKVIQLNSPLLSKYLDGFHLKTL